MGDLSAVQPIVASLVLQYDRNATILDTRLLASSTQAEVFLVNIEGRPRPLIAKLFREQRPDVSAALEDEFVSLGLMSGAFRDVDLEGWEVAAPQPLSRSSTPPALLMTAVPGVPLQKLLPTLEASVRRDIARRVCDALVAYWSSAGRIVADVTLSNILADAGKRQLSFVDPGLPIPEFACPGLPAEFAPGSRDLSYLLSHVLATNVRAGLFARRRAQVRTAFAVDVVRNYAAEHLKSDQLRAFYDEVNSCAARYIAFIPGGGPLAPWRWFVRRQTRRRLTVVLATLARR